VNQATEQARREERPLLFYPEGTRSVDGEIGEFRRGAFRAAFDHELPIQPVVIEGIEQVLPPGVWLPRSPARYPVKVCYLEPLLPPFGSGERRRVVRDTAERVRRSMVEELANLRARRNSEPPRPVAACATGGSPGPDGLG
jgi:1-acyl-sn-glycerol-3-phosphate acyltransferase